MKALVTGGNGFLGGAIARQLLERGTQVRSFARGDSPEVRALGGEVLRGDLADPDAVRRAVEGVDVVFHVAAKAGVWGSDEEYERANVTGTQHVLDACRATGVTKLVHTSSPSVVFGGEDLRGVDERVPFPSRYRAAYPRTKAQAERLVRAANGPELATVALRPHLIWGPGDPHIVPRLVERARRGKLRMVGDGKALVDTVYVDNAAEAHLLAADRLAPGSPVAGKVYFISNDEPMPMGEIIHKILRAAGVDRDVPSIPLPLAKAVGWILETSYRMLRLPGEPLMTVFLAEQLAHAHYFDLHAARQELGYAPRVSIDEGMQRLARSLASQKS